MRSNYRRIGDCIKLVDERNTDLKVTNLIGISISKQVIPSVANTIGTDMSKYKIIRKNQFACSTMQVRRDKKMPVALLREVDEAIISAAYPVFEVIDENIILPEYLMMWFSRSEFDREACFYAIGGVRGSIEWEDFCNMELPVPSIEKQKQIVKEYKVLQDRISLNNTLIEKLEETAQAIYKQWFVDFDFPDENGNPYKSSGGEIRFRTEVDKEIPAEWDIKSLAEIANYLNGLAMQNYSSTTSEYIPVIKIKELSQGYTDESSDRAETSIPSKYVINNGDVIFSWSGTLKVEFWAGGRGGLNQHLFKVTSEKYERWFYYLWTKYHLEEFKRIAAGKAVSLGHIKREHLDEAKVLIPTNSEIKKMNQLMNPICDYIVNIKIENIKLKEITYIVLSKMSSVEE